MKKVHLTVFVVASLIGTAAQAQSINYAPDGGRGYYWGASSGLFFGEAFTAPGSTLADFSLIVKDDSSSFGFVAQVYAFNGSSLVGPALYTSGLQTIGSSSFTKFTFNPNIALNQASEYIALVTNAPGGTSLGGSGAGEMETGSGGPGGFYYGYLSSPGGSAYRYSTDAAFTADFGTSVPEPSSLALMGAGLVGVIAHRRRHRA